MDIFEQDRKLDYALPKVIHALGFTSEEDPGGAMALVSAHGDKTHQYQSRWEEYDVPALHGKIIYLIGRAFYETDMYDNDPFMWVVENYDYFEPLITPFVDPKFEHKKGK